MTKKISKYGIALIALLAATEAQAGQRHGTACQPHRDSISRIGYEERGIGNYDTGTHAIVICPTDDVDQIYGDHAPTVVDVTFVDNSTTDAAYCYIWATHSDTNSTFGPTRHTCNLSGGCDGTTGQESYTGYRNIEFRTDPYFYDPLSYFGDDDYDAFGLACWVPKAGGTTSSSRSFVKNVRTISY